MCVHLVNPSDHSFGTAVITPRWLFVLAAATPRSMGDPVLIDESLEQLDSQTIQPGDIVGISVHTGNALRGYEVGRLAHNRGARVGTEASTRPCFLKSHSSAAQQTQWSRAMEMWRGARYSE